MIPVGPTLAVGLATASLGMAWLGSVAWRGLGVPAHEIEANSEGDETQREHGSGLGLWLVHRAVEALGGDVTLETSGDGTTATVIVPDRGDDVAGRT